MVLTRLRIIAHRDRREVSLEVTAAAFKHARQRMLGFGR